MTKSRLRLAWLGFVLVTAALLTAQATPPNALIVLQGHTAAVTSVDFAPDGKHLISSSDDGTVQLWDLATSRSVATLKQSGAEIYAAVYSPDGSTIAATSYDRRVYLWDASSRKLRRSLEVPRDWANAICFSRDGRYLAVGSQNGDLTLWSVDSGELLRTMKAAGPVESVACSPDNRTIALGFAPIQLFDSQNGNLLKTLNGHTNVVPSVAYSRDGNLLASAGWDKKVKVWNVDSGTEVSTIDAPKPGLPFDAVAFSPDGKQFVTAGADRVIRLRLVADAKLVKSFEGPEMTVTGLSFSPDGKRLAASSLDQKVWIWTIEP